jgi:hypothetical protein
MVLFQEMRKECTLKQSLSSVGEHISADGDVGSIYWHYAERCLNYTKQVTRRRVSKRAVSTEKTWI